jgi:DNA-binding NarL/FixJ family response regulator
MATNPNDPIKVLLAEDHTIVREGLKSLLKEQVDMEVVGEAANGREAVEAARRLDPNVVVMDLTMPELNGVDATAQIVKACPKTRVVILSMHSADEYVFPALRAGASGYLVKGSGLSELTSAIRAVHTGNAFFSPEVSATLLKKARRQDPEKGRTEKWDLLSPQIADLLNISAKTVEGHRGRIMNKLDIHDVAGLVRYAIRTGLISKDG